MTTGTITGWFSSTTNGRPWDSRIPSDKRYYITMFGGGSDAQAVACGGPNADGSWYYIADTQRFGCGTRVRVTNPDTGASCVAVAADIGPNVSVERMAGGPIIDASPLVLRHLFGRDSYGWSDRVVVLAEPVDRSTPLGPSNTQVTPGADSGSTALTAVVLVAMAGAAWWWLGTQARRRNPAKHKKPMTDTQAYKRVIETLSDMLGGEGWDDPRLLLVMRKWVSKPSFGTWEEVDLQSEAEVLVEQGFDPRDALDENE